MSAQHRSRLRQPQINVRKPLHVLPEPNNHERPTSSKSAENLTESKIIKVTQKPLMYCNNMGVGISDTKKAVAQGVTSTIKPTAIAAPNITVKKRTSVRGIGAALQSMIVKPTSNSKIGPQRVIKKRPSINVGVIRKGATLLVRKPVKASAIAAAPMVALGRKRPGIDAVPEEPPKPKQAKQKIPSWNFKERFSVLNEKHVELVQKYKDLMVKMADYSTLEELCRIKNDEIDSLTKNVTELDSRSKHYKSQFNCVSKNYDTLLNKHQQLEAKNILLVDEFQNLKNDYELLLNRDKTHIEEIEELKKTIDDLTKEFQQTETHLTVKCNKLKKENDDLILERQKLNDQRRFLHNTIQDLKGNIRVFCRVRPPINEEEYEQLMCNINVQDANFLEIRKSRETISQISGKMTEHKAEFTFDRVFSSESTQEEVFEDLAQLVQSALDGYHICVFAYGQTGSGKTYTMQGGSDYNTKGMIPRTVDLIFNKIEELQRVGWTYSVHASFLEIYNENINDLLNMKSNMKYDILYNEGKGTTVSNLNVQSIDSAAELKQLMSVAQKNRATAATNFNEHSSRSHAVTQIYLQGTTEGSQTMYTGSINLVDLAGSESAKTSSNERLTETKNINKSLSTLGDVMLALYNKSKHVPYRNSKLTYLLQSSLGGNSKTLMVVNISPFDENFGESINSLRFASKVKEVKTASKRNKIGIIPPQTPKNN